MASDEEYKLFLNHVVGLAERRQTVTTTYLSVNAAIVAAVAFFFKYGQLTGWVQGSILALLVAGLYASSLWRKLIGQYSTLISWWYKQLRALEGGMSECSRLVIKEYDELYLMRQGKAAIGLTNYEIGLTKLFTVIYVLFIIGVLIALTRTLGLV